MFVVAAASLTSVGVDKTQEVEPAPPQPQPQPQSVENDGQLVPNNLGWPQWRGPLGTGVSPLGKPPLEWSGTKNIKWKTALPGKGHSTPIVWKDRIFITAAVPAGNKLEPRYSNRPGAHDNSPVSQKHRFVVIAVNRSDGKIAWEKTVNELLPHEGGHYTASLASASPVTDGKHVYAYFGSHGLYCLDFDGNIKWQHDLGDMHSKHGHGEGSSPALHGDFIVVNWDHEEQSFVVAFDKTTGKEKWRIKRDEVTSWSTPIIVEQKLEQSSKQEGRPIVIVPGTQRIRAYELTTGKVIWECAGMSANICASPVAGHGMVFVGSSYEKRAMLAIKLAGAKGDITDSDHVVWKRTRGTPYVPSPLLYGDALYYHAHYQNVLSRLNAKTGENAPGPFRLNGIGNVYASAVGAANRVYITDLNGNTLVLSHSDQPKVLALNQLDDSFSASAAIAGKELFLRGKKHLYCIAEK